MTAYQSLGHSDRGHPGKSVESSVIAPLSTSGADESEGDAGDPAIRR